MSSSAPIDRERLIDRVLHHDAVNFALTNRIPRALATRLVARISRSQHPLVRRLSMRVWTTFGGDLALHEAKQSHFQSLHDCFTRELKEGARPIEPSSDVAISPCDGIVGACGAIEGTRAFQAKGSSYSLEDLLLDQELVDRHRGGCYVTLRLTSTMYHRFHAPDDCAMEDVIWVPGETWNVNRPALQRIDRLFCRNERAIVPLRVARDGSCLTLVPVAAILVASLRLHAIDRSLDRSYAGPSRIRCEASLRRGQEMGYFEHGSTIIVLGGRHLALAEGVREATIIRMGRPLLRYR